MPYKEKPYHHELATARQVPLFGMVVAVVGVGIEVVIEEEEEEDDGGGNWRSLGEFWDHGKFRVFNKINL